MKSILKYENAPILGITKYKFKTPISLENWKIMTVHSRNKNMGNKMCSRRVIFFKIFWRLWYNYSISPFPFLPSSPPICPSPLSLEFRASFLTHCYHIHRSIYIYTLKYNLLSQYNVTCMCVFKADHLILDMCSSLGKTTSPTPSFSWLPIAIIFLKEYSLGMFIYKMNNV